jgi:drug/metabolite transporter (DMT)-like permease
MLGALLPLRKGFEGISSGVTLGILIFLGFAEGTVTVLTAMLALQGVGLPEIYIVRTLIAGIFFTLLVLPRDLKLADFKPLTVRAIFVTGGYLFTILGVRDGDVVPVQALWATAPMLVILLEWIRLREKPQIGAMIGSVVVAVGVLVLLSAAN